MTFDEARRYLIANFEDMNLEAVISVLASVREEYEPTVEMTKDQYETFMYFLNHDIPLPRLLDEFKLHRGETLFSIPRKNLMGELSFEDLAQAWLHPKTIKIIDKEILK